MKKIVVSAGFAALALGLSACGGSPVEGKWCPQGLPGNVVFSGDKVTVSDGNSTQTGKIKIDGKTITATPDDPAAGAVIALTLSEDGKSLTASGLSFARCQ